MKPGLQSALSQLRAIVGLSFDSGPWLAGGAARAILTGEYVADLDLFFADQAQADATEAALIAVGATEKFDVSDPPSVTGDIDDDTPVVSRYFDVPNVGRVNVARTHTFSSWESVVGSFDFSCCQLASDGIMVRGDPVAIGDAVSRRLRVVRETSARRIKKYLDRGFLLHGEQKKAWEGTADGPIPGLVASAKGLAALSRPLDSVIIGGDSVPFGAR